jgi:protein-L-isoaspartate(D-aspartate) O-methyltransferase
MMPLEECRRFYADEIRFAANLRSSALAEAFARVSREAFLGPAPWHVGSPELRGLSITNAFQMSYTAVTDARDVYHNVVIVLEKSNDTNNGQPGSLARWIDAMELQSGDSVYHLGCGGGYYTAIMAEVVGPAGKVTGSEVQPGLAARAKENLVFYPNVTVHSGDGTAFDPGDCDAMLINAGVTHPLVLWLDRLREGGRLVMPLTMAATPTIGLGVMLKVVREASGFSAQILTQVAIYSCTSGRDQLREAQIRQAMSGGLTGLKSVRRDAHEKADTCVVHGPGACLSSLAPAAAATSTAT